MFVPSRPKNKRQKKEEILIDAIKTFRVLASDQAQGNQNKDNKKTDSMNSRKKCETTQKDFPNPYNPTIRF